MDHMNKITKHYSQTLYLFTVYGSFILVLLGIFFAVTYYKYMVNIRNEAARSLENMCASISNAVETQLDSLSAISLNIVYSNLIKSNFKDFSNNYNTFQEQNQTFAQPEGLSFPKSTAA